MRTDQQIIDQTNEIARILYSHMSYSVPAGAEFHSETIKRHPHERRCWAAACEIQLLLTSTDPNDAVDNLADQ